MPRAVRVLGAGETPSPINDTLIIDSDARRGLQPSVISNSGAAIELDLPPPISLRTDDVVVLDTGELLSVVAAPEQLFEVRANFDVLARIAWALGDRHVPVQILPNRIRLRADAALHPLIAALGGKIAAIETPFEPESGAYDVGGGHHDDHRDHGQHDHSDGHGHHSHGHVHAAERKR
ncbi:MAG: urease accessory protein UreE [Xanthobacteraceae bacterium]